MAGERVQRRLAAILVADVAGYSRLMGSDDEGTLAGLKAGRELIDLKSKSIAAASSILREIPHSLNLPAQLMPLVVPWKYRRKWRNVMLSFLRIAGSNFASASTLAM
jgi:hypothetical protein